MFADTARRQRIGEPWTQLTSKRSRFETVKFAQYILDFSFQHGVYWRKLRKRAKDIGERNARRRWQERNRFSRSRHWTKPWACSGNRDMRALLLRTLFSTWALDAAVCMTPSATSMRCIWPPSLDTLPNTSHRPQNYYNKRDPSR